MSKQLFKYYRHEKNQDGSYNIYGVEVFILGLHRKFNYDKTWFERAKQNHEEKTAKGNLPPIFIGHNDGTEKRACGFFDNLRLNGDMVVVDFLKIPASIFALIADRAYPNRSIEVWEKNAYISGIALLGSSEPFHKLPSLEIDHTEQIMAASVPLGAAVHFSTYDDGKLTHVMTFGHQDDDDTSFFNMFFRWLMNSKKMEPGDTLRLLMNHFDNIKKEEPQDTAGNPDGGTQTEDKNGTQKKPEAEAEGEGTMDFNEEFKQKYGMTPEEFVAKQKKEAEERLRRDREHYASLFKIKLDGMDVCPAITESVHAFMEAGTDEKVRFGKDDLDHREAFEKLITDIIEKATEGELVVNMQETAGGKGTQNFDDDDDDPVTIDKGIKKIMREKGVDYNEGFEIFFVDRGGE